MLAPKPDRRHFVKLTAGGIALFATPGLYAEKLTAVTRNSRALEGPFYPDKMPLDTDNDLIIINDSVTPAVGEITYLHGRVLSKAGEPIRNAFVEIWQCDMNQSYLHTRGQNPEKGLDTNFQGYGKCMTNGRGEYFFRTIKPIPYTLLGIFRTPHIHFAISKSGRRIFTTQMLINGHPDNPRDGLTRNVRDPLAKETILVDFNPLDGTSPVEYDAQFDIILGKTLQEFEVDGKTQWGLGRPGMFG